MGDLEILQTRVTQLEELLSHQEHLIEQLSDVAIQLRRDYDGLSDSLSQRLDKLEGQREAKASSLDPDERPPHY